MKNLSATKPPIPAMGLLAEGVARYESGLLVHGDQVTDLLTGFSLTVPPINGPDTASTLAFRGSGIDLQELDDLTELVTQVMQQRMNSPHAAGLDSGIPRDHFPYGVGESEPDVLVTGGQAAPIATYLRAAGFRARVVDTQYAMTLASSLAVAQQELQALSPEPSVGAGTGGAGGVTGVVGAGTATGTDVVGQGAPAPGVPPGEEARTTPNRVLSWDLSGSRDKAEPARSAVNRGGAGAAEPRKLPLGASPVAAVFVAIIIVAGAMAAGLALDAAGGAGEDTQAVANAEDGDGAAGQVGPGAGESTGGEDSGEEDPDRNRQPETPPPFTPPPNRPGMQDPKINGKDADHRAAARADVPVTADWPKGWNLAEATPQRETYQSEKDAGMRVLLAAKPAPLKNQAELDKAVLKALRDAPGTKVASESPVSYREKYPDSETLWYVRLVDGHQVSIGCQYREPNPVRSRVCEQVVDSARPER